MKKALFLTWINAMCIFPLFSQTIHGVITNKETNVPIPYASISVKNSSLGTVTDHEGFFALEGAGKNMTLMVSCMGFEMREINLSDHTNDPLEISLNPVSIHLNRSVVITASANELLSFQSPDAVTVLTNQELKINAPRSMAEALIGTTGVWMQKTNHGAGSPFLRGLTGNQTLILVDGIRLNNSIFRYGPNQYFNALDVFSVDRVEVVRGKGSVFYGSDAIGGAINVITKTPEYAAGNSQLRGRGKLKYMNQGMELSGLGGLSYHAENFAMAGNFSYKDFGDIYAGGDLGFERPSGYSETGIDLKARWRPSATWQVTSAYQYLSQHDVPRFDQVAQRGYKTYSYDPQMHSLLYAKAEHFGKSPLFRKISMTLSSQLSDEVRKIQKEGSPIFREEHDVVNTLGFTAETYSEIAGNWEAITGFSYYADEVESGAREITQDNGGQHVTTLRGLYPDDSGTKSMAAFSKHTLKLGKFHLGFGSRFNMFHIRSEDEEFGKIILNPSSLVGNLDLQYFATPKQQFILSAHSAFRAPNINDISTFGLFDYGIEIPSTRLAPEKSITVEGIYKRTVDRLSLAICAFNTRLNDQIERAEATYQGSEFIDGERVYQKQNIARSNIFGIEWEGGLKLSREIAIINNLAWLYGKNLENGEPMRRIPPLNGKVAVQYSKSGIFAEAEFLFAAMQDRLSQGDIDDHRIPAGGTPGWNILNLKTGSSWNKFSVYGGLQNIFNRSYRIHGSGIDGCGRSLWLSIEFEI